MIGPLWLDYRRPPPGRHRLGWIVLSLFVLTAVALLARYMALAERIDVLEASLTEVRAKGAAAEEAAESGVNAAMPTAEWERMFAALESAGGENVTLLSLRPGPGELQLGGEAWNNDAAVDYVARLNASAVFASVNLTQTEIMREQPRQPVRFTALARWDKAGP